MSTDTAVWLSAAWFLVGALVIIWVITVFLYLQARDRERQLGALAFQNGHVAEQLAKLVKGPTR